MTASIEPVMGIASAASSNSLATEAPTALPNRGSSSTGVLPPVLMAHGFGSSHQHNWGRTGWLDVLADLNRSAIPFDLPGHGAATGLPLLAGESVTGRIIDAIGKERSVDGLGFSAGAHALLATACQHPERIRRLALLGIGDNVFDHDPCRAVQLAESLERETPPEDQQARLFWRMVNSAGNSRVSAASYLRTWAPIISETALLSIDLPILIAVGDRDEFATPLGRLCAALPQAELLTLRKTDHFATAASLKCIEKVAEFLCQ